MGRDGRPRVASDLWVWEGTGGPGWGGPASAGSAVRMVAPGMRLEDEWPAIGFFEHGFGGWVAPLLSVAPLLPGGWVARYCRRMGGPAIALGLGGWVAPLLAWPRYCPRY